jgi:glycosyltransferase involved in cell wall biosynthesis
MRIVISTKRYRPIIGGSIQYAVMLAGAFREKGHDVRIMTRTPGPNNENNLYRKPSAKMTLELAAWSDVLLQVDASWRDVWPFLIKRVPWFPTIHFGYPQGPLSSRTKLELAGLKTAFQIGRPISVGHEVARSWALGDIIIPNPYDDSIFHKPPAEHPRDIDLLFVGRIEHSKGVFIMLDALRQIAPTLFSPIRCAFVGSGVDETRLAQEIDLGIDNVIFESPGACTPAEVAHWMRRSRCLVFPTTPDWIEASPLTPLEALACGCRIIATDNGGTRENIGPQGTLVTSGDTKSLQQALHQELTNPTPVDHDAVESFLSFRRLPVVAAQYLHHFEQAIKPR